MEELWGKRLSLDDAICFDCSERLPCFGKCCTSAPNIWLTPYDIIRIKNNLAVGSRDFLRSYTETAYPPEAGYPTIWVKRRSDADRSCPFSTDKGCAVYADRPWVCRIFPLVPIWTDGRPAPCADESEPLFTFNRVGYCRGFNSLANISIRQWRERQGLIIYEEINARWKMLTHHRNFPTRNFLEGPDAEIFFTGCYDIDEFRKIALEQGLLKVYAAENNACENSLDDADLLKISLRWLLRVMFGENIPRPGR